MLREIPDLRQFPDEGFRRWFSDRDQDVIVWYADETRQEVIGFQICYDKQETEHALTWYKERGFSHNRIDDGEVPFSTKMSPVLVADGMPPLQRILEDFEASSEGIIEEELRQFIRDTIKGVL